MVSSYAGLLIFVAFFLPGFLAERSRQVVVPLPLRPTGAIKEAGALIFSSVLIHSLLCMVLWVFTPAIQAILFAGRMGFTALLWQHPQALFIYLWVALIFGYLFGFLEGWLALRTPIRVFILKWMWPKKLLGMLGVSVLLDERPVWFTVLQESPTSIVYVEAVLKDGAGYYTGRLATYAILDDTNRNKDICLTEAHFKKNEGDLYAENSYSKLLLNFQDINALRISFISPAQMSASIESASSSITRKQE